MDQPRSVRFNCGHAMLCSKCLPTFMAQAAARCPHCRTPLRSMEKMHFGEHVSREGRPQLIAVKLTARQTLVSREGTDEPS